MDGAMDEHVRFCSSCGFQLPYTDTHFCPGCGSPTGPSHDAQQPGTWRRVALPLVSILVIIGLAGGAYVLAGRGGGDRVVAVAGTATPTPSPTTEPSPAAPSPTTKPSSGPTALDATQVATRLGPGVLRVEVDGCDMTGTGTAFAISPRHLVTNHHVVSIDSTPVLVDRTGRQRQGRVIGWRESPDLAVIEVSEPLPVVLPWASTSALTEGQTLVALGYPVPDLAFSVTQADIVSFQEEGGVRRAVRTDGAVDRGNSGGPALTLEGEVAGVVTEMADNSSGFQLVALLYTADALEADVQDILAAPQTVEPTCDADPEELPEEWFEEDGGAAEAPPEAYSYGDDPTLDALQDSCADGDMAACDRLYRVTPGDSAYEAFGSTCGERTDERFGECVAWEAEAPEAEEPSGPEADLAGLRSACAAGDASACDSLYWQSPSGSEEETFGATCGGRAEYEGGTCEERAGTS